MRYLLLVMLGVAGQIMFAQSPEIPPEHAEKAKLALEAGYPYYIWYDGKEPIHGERLFGGGSFAPQAIIRLNIQFAATGETLPPFLLRQYVYAVAEGGKAKKKSLERYSSESTTPTQPNTRRGEESANYLSLVQLSGEGDMEISLIEPEANSNSAKPSRRDKKSEPRQLSNTLRVHVVFGTEDKK